MASKLTAKMSVVIMVVVAMMVLWNGATAQSNSCMSSLVGLTPCLSYVTGNSSAPSSSCCTQLSGVVQSNPQCLCMLVNGGGGSNLGVNINQTLALALPAACKVQTPSVSQCNAAAGPTSVAAVPASSPVGSQAPPSSEPKETPQVPSTPAGSKTVPSTTTGASSAADNTAKVYIHFLGFLVFAATLSLSGFGI